MTNRGHYETLYLKVVLEDDHEAFKKLFFEFYPLFAFLLVDIFLTINLTFNSSIYLNRLMLLSLYFLKLLVL